MKVRRRFIRKRKNAMALRPNPGSAPGVLRANPLHHPSELYVIGYGPDGYVEQKCNNVEEIHRFLSVWPNVWIDVIGLGNVEMLEQLGILFNLDRLSLEDVLDTTHRPKVEYNEHHVFSILKSGLMGDQFESEQISLFLKKNVVVAFEEKPGHSFEQVRERIRRGTGKIRHNGSDYLFYALIDEVVDKYFPILDKLNTQLTSMEDAIMTSSGSDNSLIHQIHHMKSDLLLMHRAIWPLSDIINMMMREESPMVTKATRTYMRDCYDHSLQLNEMAQFYRDSAAGLLNTYLAYEGHKTNEIIKLLTLVSSVFIPLNFIASIYGMNFRDDKSPLNMPELHWYYGYPFALGLMLTVALGMVWLFRRRGWIGQK